MSSLFIHVCLKMGLCLMTQFFTSFGITQYTEGAIYTKNFLLFHSIVLLFLMNETREVIVKN